MFTNFSVMEMKKTFRSQPVFIVDDAVFVTANAQEFPSLFFQLFVNLTTSINNGSLADFVDR